VYLYNQIDMNTKCVLIPRFEFLLLTYYHEQPMTQSITSDYVINV